MGLYIYVAVDSSHLYFVSVLKCTMPFREKPWITFSQFPEVCVRYTDSRIRTLRHTFTRHNITLPIHKLAVGVHI